MKVQLKYLGQVVLFTGFLAVVYPIIIATGKTVLPTKYMRNVPYPVAGYGHMHTRVRDAANTNKVDVLFLGSSHAYRGFDTRIWKARGFSSFNYGSSAQTPLQSELLLKSSMTTLDPGIVIMEVNPIIFANDGVESALDLIANRPIDRATLGMVYREQHIKTTNALLYGSLRQAIGYDNQLMEDPNEDDAEYIKGGFVQRTTGKFEPEGEQQQVNSENEQIQLEAFQRLVSLVREEGKELILIEAPVTHWTYAQVQEPQRTFEQMMIGQEKFLNMNGKVALNDTLHFTDGHHLNQAGVELFNAALIDTLERRNWLPSK